MNNSLKWAIDTVEQLSEQDHDELARIIDAFVGSRASQAEPVLSEAESTRMQTRLTEPFEEADPHAVNAFFNKHGC